MKKEIGEVISTFRKISMLKQSFIAYKLGITTNAYANIERGRTDINSEKLIIIAKIYGLKAYQIIVLAEEIIEVGEIDWLPNVVKIKLRLINNNFSSKELTFEEKYFIDMDKKVYRSSFERMYG